VDVCDWGVYVCVRVCVCVHVHARMCTMYAYIGAFLGAMLIA